MTAADLHSPEFAELRHDVALANRIAHKTGLVSAYGHISGRIPGTNQFFFPTRRSPALAHPDRLLILDTDGHIIAGEGMPNTEFWIHARIYAARPDVGSVAHVHSTACIILGQTSHTVRVIFNSAAPFHEGVPVYEQAGLIRTRERGEAVAQSLGSKRAMLLRGHGANIAGSHVRQTILLATFLEEAADMQARALAVAGGDESRVRYFDAEEAAHLAEQIGDSGPMDRGWEYLAQMVEGELA